MSCSPADTRSYKSLYKVGLSARVGTCFVSTGIIILIVLIIVVFAFGAACFFARGRGRVCFFLNPLTFIHDVSSNFKMRLIRTAVLIG